MDQIADFWNGLGAWRWLSIAAVLVGVEIATGSSWFLWLAVAAGLMAAVVALPGDLSLASELIAYAGLALATTIAGRRLLPSSLFRSDAPALNDPGARLIGSRAVAVADFVHGEGRVRLGDTEWRGLIEGAGRDAPAGAALEVVGVEGGTLRLAPVAPETPPPAPRV
jgi:membrane protein implicated in regulation of membrane protease activity